MSIGIPSGVRVPVVAMDRSRSTGSPKGSNLNTAIAASSRTAAPPGMVPPAPIHQPASSPSLRHLIPAASSLAGLRRLAKGRWSRLAGVWAVVQAVTIGVERRQGDQSDDHHHRHLLVPLGD